DGVNPTTVETENTSLQIETNGEVQNTDITVTQHMENPAGNNVANPDDLAAGAYVEVNASSELRDNLSRVFIKVYYNEAEIDDMLIEESSLRLYLWNTEQGMWQVVGDVTGDGLANAADVAAGDLNDDGIPDGDINEDGLPDSGVNTGENYLWGWTNHFSQYGVFGSAVVTPAPTPPPSDNGTVTPPSSGGGTITPPSSGGGTLPPSGGGGTSSSSGGGATGGTTTTTPSAPTPTTTVLPPSSAQVTLKDVTHTSGGVTVATMPTVGADFTTSDKTVGQVEATVKIELNTVPSGAQVQVQTARTPGIEVSSAFQLAATDSGMEIVDTAYVINVIKTDLRNGTDVKNATITMNVGSEWVAAHGGTNAVRIIRFDPATGTTQMLQTNFRGYDARGRAIFEGISLDGLSVFGLVAVKSAPAIPVARYKLVATVDPLGSGTVTFSPAQPADGYDAGTAVSLTASANTGYNFDRWSVDASGTAKTATVTMNSDKSITAHFSALPPPPPKYTLTINIEPTGSGTITLSPAQPDGGYDAGTTVSLTAQASKGYTFDRWSGDISGTIKTATLTMEANRSVTARFTPLDTVAPGVLSANPANGAEDVPVDTRISVIFSEPMDKVSVEEAFSIIPQVKGAFSWEDSTLVFTPEKKLKSGNTYAVIISTRAKDANGNALNAVYKFTVTTESKPATIRILAGLIAAGVAIAAIVIFLVARRKSKRSESQT
ncbi:MAG: Ig-like domain-containing protein, partial [Dehalococcoidia bacterium]